MEKKKAKAAFCHRAGLLWPSLIMMCRLLVLITHLVKQFCFHLIQLIRQIHVDVMGIYKSLGFIPEGVLFPGAVSLDVHNRRAFVDALPVLENRYQKLPQGVASAL